jgi:centractin
LKLSRPIANGVVEAWDDMEYLWSQVVASSDAGLGLTISEHPLLVTEPALGQSKQRERVGEVAFESLGVPALYVSAQAPLALYAAGKTTGTVLDVGDGVCQCVPVYEGLALSHAAVRTNLGGSAVTDRLRHLLRSSGLVLEGGSASELVREIKEQVCRVVLDPGAAEGAAAAASTSASRLAGGPRGNPSASASSAGGASSAASSSASAKTSDEAYRLPDGRVIEIGPAGFRAPELLFQPTSAGIDCPGVQEALAGAVFRSDMELRRALWGSVELVGGTTLLPGFGQRLLQETRRLAPSGTKIRLSAKAGRGTSVWVGGSILASMTTFRKMWIDKAQWEEDGSRALLHKAAI